VKDFWKIVGLGIAILIGVAILGFVGSSLMTLTSVATAPGRVISKTMETDSVIASYEFFKDAHNQVKARVAQIAGHKKILADTTDAAEKSRLRIELSAIQQGCRDLVGKYNANAEKMNKSIFQGESPSYLEPAICE